MLLIKRRTRFGRHHRHLREIDCSMAVVDGPAAGAECGANQYTCPAYSAKKYFIVAAVAGDIITTVDKGRWARPMSSLPCLDVNGRYLTWSNYALMKNTLINSRNLFCIFARLLEMQFSQICFQNLMLNKNLRPNICLPHAFRNSVKLQFC